MWFAFFKGFYVALPLISIDLLWLSFADFHLTRVTFEQSLILKMVKRNCFDLTRAKQFSDRICDLLIKTFLLLKQLGWTCLNRKIVLFVWVFLSVYLLISITLHQHLDIFVQRTTNRKSFSVVLSYIRRPYICVIWWVWITKNETPKWKIKAC